jgi:hypothetical protein
VGLIYPEIEKADRKNPLSLLFVFPIKVIFLERDEIPYGDDVPYWDDVMRSVP